MGEHDYLADASFRDRCRANLARFERVSDVDGTGGRRAAAVVVAIVAGEEGRACLVVTQRAASLRAHARQYALPGGRLDPGEDAVAAARREAEEEVGLVCEPGDVLGLLDDYSTRSGFLITPVVVWGPPAATLRPNPAEVAAVHLLAVSELDHPDAPRLSSIPESEQPVIQMPMGRHWIHAPTAAVLYQFREVAVHGRPTRVAHFEEPPFAWR